MFRCLKHSQSQTKCFSNLLSFRFIHRNHPGHKKKPFAVVQKLDLPDRYLPEASYPPVKPKLPPGSWPDDVEPSSAWKYFDDGQRFHSLKTIQERLTVMAYSNIQQTLNELRVRGTRWSPIHIVSSISKTPRMLPFNQYITKTDIKEMNDKNGVELNKSVDTDLYEKIKSHIEENINLFLEKQKELKDTHEIPPHPDTYKPEVFENEKELKEKFDKGNSTIKIIMNTCTSILATNESNKHLLNAQYGSNINIKAYWKRCGFKEQSARGADKKNKDVISFQYDDEASYQIKCDMPLLPLIDRNECLESNQPGSIEPFCSPKQAYNPVVYKIYADHILPMQVPGHWYGDKREFNFLTVLNTTKQIDYFHKSFDGYKEDLENYKSMAITSPHAELTAQAYYLGFSMWKDLTYPLRGQYVLSNGQDFCFTDYQLNTLNLWNPANKVKNVCSFSMPKRLWEQNRETLKIKINDDVLKQLINLLVTQPIKNEEEICKNYSQLDYMIGGTRLRPYLSIQNMKDQLTTRHMLLATSLYELVKYDRPLNYLNMISDTLPKGSKPKFHISYDQLTYSFRDIVLDYYPRDFYGISLVERMFLRKAPKQTEKFWDLKTPVFEWANVPPPHTNNVPRVIDLQKF